MNENQEDLNSKPIETSQPEQADEGKKCDDQEAEPREIPLDKMTKAELLDKMKEVQEQADKNYDLYVRAQAEIENIKKRNQKDKVEWIKYANETLIKELLPVMDHLEQAIAHTNDESSGAAIRDGLELTLKGLRDTLARSGLEEVKAKGERFDPCVHHAVSQQEDETVAPGIILHELQKGFTLNQRLIRPAMVVVSSGRHDGSAQEDRNHDETCEKGE